MDRRFQKYNSQTVVNSRFCYRGLEIQYNIRFELQHNIYFHVFFDYAPGITCFLSSRTVLWYTNKASIESLWTVDSKNIIFRPLKIQVSATGALKFNRTSGSKEHNINFHVFFDRDKFKFLLQGPWNSIEHQVRNSIILTFTSFSIMHLE